MKYLRMLIALLLGSGFFGLTVLLARLFGFALINQSGIRSSPLIYLAVLSLIPFINIAALSWKSPLPSIEGVSENALTLKCSYSRNVSEDLASAKRKVIDIANSLIVKDHELVKTYEDDAHLEFSMFPEEISELKKTRRTSIAYKDTAILAGFEATDGGGTRVELKVESDRPISLFANNYNREILNALIAEIDQAFG